MIIRKDTPLYGGKCQGFAVWTVRGVPFPARKHANVFRSGPESTPMCSAVHSGRGSRAFYGQKARLCARGHALT